MAAGGVEVSAFETLIYEKKKCVASVTLNRPEALNAFNVQMRDDLYEILGAIIDDPDVRVVIFKGAGVKAFCAGADLKEFLGAPPPVAARHVRFRRDPWGLFQKVPQPIIAALHGYVLGSGIEIALCCDIRIASEDVRIGLPEVGLGIIPAAGGTQTLPRIVGRARALEMLLANRWLGGEEAFRFGLVNRVVAKDRLLVAAEELAETIASRDPLAVRSAKQAVARGMDLPLAEGLDLERRLAAGLGRKADKMRKEGKANR